MNLYLPLGCLGFIYCMVHTQPMPHFYGAPLIGSHSKKCHPHLSHHPYIARISCVRWVENALGSFSPRGHKEAVRPFSATFFFSERWLLVVPRQQFLSMLSDDINHDIFLPLFALDPIRENSPVPHLSIAPGTQFHTVIDME